MTDGLNSRLDKTILIPPSRCDSTGRLGVPDCFDMFMDIASENAEELGVGASALTPRNLFWITVKTKIKFFRRPMLTERVTISTWPEAPKEYRCNRYYELSKQGETLAAGKTEWTVMNMKTHELHRVDEIYSDDIVLSDEKSLDEPFRRFHDDFDGEPFAEHKVDSVDIDFGGHMNNVAYIRAIEGAFSSEEWNQMNVSEAEVIYRHSCHEGDLLKFWRRDTDDGIVLKGALDDERPMIYAFLK